MLYYLKSRASRHLISPLTTVWFIQSLSLHRFDLRSNEILNTLLSTNVNVQMLAAGISDEWPCWLQYDKMA
jgi:hypothetical protein